MITDGKKSHYLTYLHCFKEIHQIMKDIFIVSTDLVHTPQKINLKNMKKYAYRCHIEMPKWVEKILKYNPGEKSLKAPFEKSLTNYVKS